MAIKKYEARIAIRLIIELDTDTGTWTLIRISPETPAPVEVTTP